MHRLPATSGWMASMTDHIGTLRKAMEDRGVWV
ncbi:hypothetical protein SGRIM128S_00075 [Streptomyces griseomycini]